MKTLANCNPKEFLSQTNKIRKSVARWLDLTKVMEIRSRKPQFAEDATEEEKKAAVSAQIKKNLSEMLDVILDEYPDETAELLGLVCFIAPEDLGKHTMAELMTAITEVINDRNVIGFFTSLVRLAQTNI